MLFDLLRPRAEITDSGELARVLVSGTGNDSGIAVNSESAMRSAAVYACVITIAETVAQLPLILYKRTGDKKDRAPALKLYSLLHNAPNELQTSFEFRLAATAQILMRGAFYAFINRSVTGEILELIPFAQGAVKPQVTDAFGLMYQITDKKGSYALAKEKVFKVIGFTLDGVTGISPIEYHRQTIGGALAAARQSVLSTKNGAKFHGILEHPGKLKDDQVAKRIRESFDEAFSGDNVYKTPLLEEGMIYKPVSMSNVDAQYIERIKFSIEDIARIFRVQPHKIGHLERSTNNNIESQSGEFLTDTMMPWFVRWEQAIARDLIGIQQSKTYFAEFLVDGMLRGDLKARAEYYSKAVGGPWLAANEARVKENHNPKDGYDDILKPMNMGGANAAQP